MGSARAAVVAALAVLLLLAAPVQAALSPREPLGHVGRWVTDADGRVVMLRGVAVVPGPDTATAEELGFSRDDAEFIARQGWNAVRLGWYSRQWEPEPAKFDQGYLDAYLRTQDTLADAGVFTVLDFHQDMLSSKYQGRGFADWFIRDDGIPNQPQVGFPGNYFFNAALNRAYDNLWNNTDGLQDQFAEGWRRGAAAFAGRTRFAGYDIFNEPWPGSAWPSCANPQGCPAGGFDQTKLTAFSNRVIAAIRRADPRHLAFYEPNLQFDVGAQTGHGKANDPNAGMSFHNYCLGAAPGLPHAPDPGNLCRNVGERGVFQNAEDHSAATGAALLMTEFGDVDDPAIHRRITDLADEFMVGWTMWAYLGSGGGPLIKDQSKPPTGDNVDADLLAALVRPYPRIVAGTPRRFGFDRERRRFTLEYSTRLPDGRRPGELESEVYVPPLDYGSAYLVRLQGAEATGGLGTPAFRVRACPGVGSVSVSVTDEASHLPPTCVEGRGGAGPESPPRPTGTPVHCPRGNSPTVRCTRTTLADGRRVTAIVGTRRSERLVGTRGRDVIVCGAGSDRVRAGSGDDVIRCGSGDDRIRAGRGDDLVFSGSGNDRVAAGPGRDRISTGSGRDRVRTRDRHRDRVGCGRGRDRVGADRRDAVRHSCERVRRART
jgi:endoglycosylceramidase